MEEQIKKKKRKKKWYFLIIVAIIGMIAFIASDSRDLGVWFDDEFSSSLTGSLESVEIDGGEIGIESGSLYFRRNNKEVRIDVIAVINGTDFSATNNLDWWHIRQGNNFKFGANYTIPDTPVGGFIANNLEKIEFDILLNNVTAGQFRNALKNGFHYKDECTRDGIYTTCKEIRFDFSDIIRKLNRVSDVEIIRHSPNNITLSFDVEDINFFRGQVIDLDPTVTITDVSSVASILTNITTENNFTHLTINETAGILFYMPFDTNTSTTTTYDYVNGSTNNPIVSNEAHFVNDGFIGGAFSFDGVGDVLTFSSLDVLSGLTETTVCAWNKHATGDTGSDGFIGRGANPNRQFALGKQSTEVFRFYIDNSTGGTDFAQSDTTMGDTDWHHVCGTYNGTTVDIYVDGVDDNSAQDVGVSGPIETAPSGVGGEIGDGEALFSAWNGTLDEIIIYDRVLTSTEIAQLFANQSDRFFIRGQQEFQTFDPTKAAGDNRLNLTIDAASNGFFDSNAQFRIGQATQDNYSTSALPFVPEFWFRFDNLTTEGEDNVTDFGSRSMNITCSTCPDSITSTDRFFGSKKFASLDTYAGTVEDIISNITILVWVNVTDAASDGTIIAKRVGSVTNGEWDFHTESTGELLGFDCGGTIDTSEGAFTISEWNLIGMTFNQDTDEIVWYINGLRDSTDTNTDSCLIADLEGIDLGVGEGFFTGEMDELMLFERILTDDEVNEIFIKGGFDYSFNDYQEILAITTVSNISIDTNYTFIDMLLNAGNSSDNPFISSNLVNDLSTDPWTEVEGDVDAEAPIFFNFFDNNDSFVDNGNGLFNASINSTNGTVFLEINNTNFTAFNISAVFYNATANLSAGVYPYYWGSWGNGTSNIYNISNIRHFTVNASVVADSCTYTSGNYIVECADNCSITANITIDDGSNISMTGVGRFNITDGVRIENWRYRFATDTCYYQAFGNGGFFGANQ